MIRSGYAAIACRVVRFASCCSGLRDGRHYRLTWAGILSPSAADWPAGRLDAHAGLCCLDTRAQSRDRRRLQCTAGRRSGALLAQGGSYNQPPVYKPLEQDGIVSHGQLVTSRPNDRATGDSVFARTPDAESRPWSGRRSGNASGTALCQYWRDLAAVQAGHSLDGWLQHDHERRPTAPLEYPLFSAPHISARSVFLKKETP